MSEKERIKLVINFTDFINNNYKLIKSMYKLFENGVSNIEFGSKKATMEIENPQNIPKPEDTFKTTMLLAYISMKQMEKPNLDRIEILEEEFIEVDNFCEFLKANNKDFIKQLKGE